MDARLLEVAEKMGMSERSLKGFLTNHDRFLSGENEIEVPGPNGSARKIYPNWPLYYRLMDHVVGKPAVSEPKPQSVDPFKEIEGREPITDDALNRLLTPKKTLPPPPEA